MRRYGSDGSDGSDGSEERVHSERYVPGTFCPPLIASAQRHTEREIHFACDQRFARNKFRAPFLVTLQLPSMHLLDPSHLSLELNYADPEEFL